jgi:stalled ribosome alternative rescue factor ArfA
MFDSSNGAKFAFFSQELHSRERRRIVIKRVNKRSLLVCSFSQSIAISSCSDKRLLRVQVDARKKGKGPFERPVPARARKMKRGTHAGVQRSLSLAPLARGPPSSAAGVDAMI